MRETIDTPVKVTLEYSTSSSDYVLTGELRDVVLDYEVSYEDVSSFYTPNLKVMSDELHTLAGKFIQNNKGIAYTVKVTPKNKEVPSATAELFKEVEQSISFTIAKEAVTEEVVREFKRLHDIPAVADVSFYDTNDSYSVTFSW